MINSLSRVRKTHLFIAFGVSVVMLLQGVKAYTTLTEKARSQEEVTEGVFRWKQSYMALADTVKKWEKNYRSENSVQDIFSIISLVSLSEYGLSAGTDDLVLTKVDPVVHNGFPVGLTKVCLASAKGGDSSGLKVQAPTYESLFPAIKRLSRRPDVYIGTISIKGDSGGPIATLGDFCILLRRG